MSAAFSMDDMESCAKRVGLVNAIAAKARVLVPYILGPSAEAIPCSRIRGGHHELYTSTAGWQRSTDLLNQTASS